MINLRYSLDDDDDDNGLVLFHIKLCETANFSLSILNTRRRTSKEENLIFFRPAPIIIVRTLRLRFAIPVISIVTFPKCGTHTSIYVFIRLQVTPAAYNDRFGKEKDS